MLEHQPYKEYTQPVVLVLVPNETTSMKQKNETATFLSTADKVGIAVSAVVVVIVSAVILVVFLRHRNVWLRDAWYV